MLIGEFVIKRNGKLERYNKFDDIPSSFEHLISFKPDYPEPPHTEEQHEEMSTYQSKLKELFSSNEAVINCIAETDFNKCNHYNGIEANVAIPSKISKLISESSIFCVHISTDAFYESESNNSNENSKIRLNNHYAQQKFDAELALADTNSLLLRTSFVGKNHRNAGMINYLIEAYS